MKDTNWIDWHKKYDQPDAPITRRLRYVQSLIRGLLQTYEQDNQSVNLTSICAGDGRDIIEVLHERSFNININVNLVEINDDLVETAKMQSKGLSVNAVCGDAGSASSFSAFPRANIIVCVGALGHLNPQEQTNLIISWKKLLEEGGYVIWSLGAWRTPDLRDFMREKIVSHGYREIEYRGAPEVWGIGLVKLITPTVEFNPSERYFNFGSKYEE